MNPEFYKTLASQNIWEAIYPEIALVSLALVLLLLEILLPAKRHHLIPRIAIFGQLVLLMASIMSLPVGTLDREVFGGMIHQNVTTEICRVFFLLASIVVCYFGNVFFTRRSLPRIEFFHITLVVTAALMLLAQASDFMMLFVVLETVTIGFYVLVSYLRGSSLSLEAGLKYLVLGALSSAIMLFGIVLIFGAVSATVDPTLVTAFNFGVVSEFALANPDDTLLNVGAALVICGIAFKIGAVPFQIWIPDVYQGAPTPVTSFLAVSSKAGGFIVLVNLVQGPFQHLEATVLPMLQAIAVITILFGNITALTQRNIKRLLGLSGIAHAGYLLLGVCACFFVDWAFSAILFYLFTYLFASFAVFGVLTVISVDDDHSFELDQFEDFARRNPFLGVVLVLGLGSLAGIPPLAGFIGKALIFIAAFEAQLFFVLGAAIVGVVISIYYYFGFIRTIVYKRHAYNTEEVIKTPDTLLPKLTSGNRIVIGCLTAMVVVIGFYQGIIGFVFL